MLDTTIKSSFANQGQICLCGSRILERPTAMSCFKKDFVEATKKLKVGDPKADTTNQGALVSQVHHEKVLSYIELVKTGRWKNTCRGLPLDLSHEGLNGWFYNQP